MQFGIALESSKLRPLELAAVTGMVRIKRGAPCHPIFLVHQLSYRDVGKIGIAEKLGAVEESAPEGLRGQVNGLSRVAAQRAQVITFEYVERLHQRDSARGGRRRAQDLIAAITSVNGPALFDFVVSQVLRRDQTAALLDRRRNLPRHFAMVEVVRIGRDFLQRGSQFRLAENFAGLVVLAIALKDLP